MKPNETITAEWLQQAGFRIEKHDNRWQKFVASIVIPTTGISRSSIWVACAVDDYFVVSKRGHFGDTCDLYDGPELHRQWLIDLCRLLEIPLKDVE
jgi:hypothetical protein